ncbi:hypothetical protein [Streptomyces sp. VRA16 Mangrove soil]|uniref:hypothetical protein n=1 Tax=Streptomyces sp. VRA16 Mangrove soil TaxID=2817434 RepID=UPI001A9F96FE|nr:hypothetical protein [Streptomyces sp. VRA16 Mangrove soil]MBO1336370.1 hypothetical protein [Streptomyces sp. VRA16 Mangrove soil]
MQEQVAFIAVMLPVVVTALLVADSVKGKFTATWLGADLVLICSGCLAYRGWRQKRFQLTTAAVLVMLGLAGASRLLSSA